MVVTSGDTGTDSAFNTEPTPLSILAVVPFSNDAVRLADPPVRIDVGLVAGTVSAVKLVMTGAATTVTVVERVSVVPAAFITVRV